MKINVKKAWILIALLVGLTACSKENGTSGIGSQEAGAVGSAETVTESSGAVGQEDGQTVTQESGQQADQGQESGSDSWSLITGEEELLVGKDIPEGSYYAELIDPEDFDGMSYVTIYLSPERALDNSRAGYFAHTRSYFHIKEGEMITGNNALIHPADQASPTQPLDIGHDGSYKVGFDIEPGEYTLKKASPMSSYFVVMSSDYNSIYSNPEKYDLTDVIVYDSGDSEAEEAELVLEEGQYVYLIDSMIIKK